jgi:hypothetical protein
MEVNASAIEETAKTIRKISPNTNAELAGQTITPEEIHAALQKGGRNKAPGSDGMGLEFYTTNWKIIKEDIAEILNQMFLKRGTTPQYKQGFIICLPKSNAVQTPEGYRPITLFNSDYKLLVRTREPPTPGAGGTSPNQPVLQRPGQLYHRSGIHSSRGRGTC